jgi:hypothetical protein
VTDERLTVWEVRVGQIIDWTISAVCIAIILDQSIGGAGHKALQVSWAKVKERRRERDELRKATAHLLFEASQVMEQA